jgi:hypothetical protein
LAVSNDLEYLRALLNSANGLLIDVENVDDPPGLDVRTRDVLEWHDLLTRLAATVNQIKVKTDKHKNAAKFAVIDKFEHEELEGAPTLIDGTHVTFKKYEHPHPHIENEEALRAWAEEEDTEAFFEPDRRFRKEVLSGFVKRHEDDGEPLPPGLGIYRETKLSRTTKSGKEASE